jgi:hypothetical protein
VRNADALHQRSFAACICSRFYQVMASIYSLSFLSWLCCSELVGRLVSGDFALNESICQVIAEAFAVQATLYATCWLCPIAFGTLTSMLQSLGLCICTSGLHGSCIGAICNVNQIFQDSSEHFKQMPKSGASTHIGFKKKYQHFL